MIISNLVGRTFAVLLGLIFGAGIAYAEPGDTQLISASPVTGVATGAYLNYFSAQHSISTGGRFVVFESFAAGLVRGGTSGANVFVHDRDTHSFEQINLTSNGEPAGFTSWDPAMSANGRYVAFGTNSATLIPGMNADFDWMLVLRDRKLGTTELVSVDRTGASVRNGDSPSISDDGRYVLFTSAATDLVYSAAGQAGSGGVFLRNRATDRTQRLSRCERAGAISANGRYAVYDGCDGLVAKNLETGTIEKVSINAGIELWGFEPYVSADGRFVAFSSYASIRPGDSSSLIKIYVRDRQLGTTELVSVDSNAVLPTRDCESATISNDGRYVEFRSYGQELVRDGFAGGIFVHDRRTHTTIRASVDAYGGGTSIAPRGAISPDGRIVAFNTDTSLVANDRNGLTYDVYVHELGEVRTPVFSYGLYPATLDFGDRTLYTKSNLKFSFTNTGKTLLPIVGTRLIQSGRPVFSRSVLCTSASAALPYIYPGHSCSVLVTLDAASLGPKSAVLEVVAGTAAPATRPVHANVVKASYSLSVKKLGFAGVTIGGHVTRSVTISNIGAGVLPLVSIRLGGRDANQFRIVSRCPTQVPAGGTCTVNVTFEPTSLGGEKAILAIIPGGGAAAGRVMLSGWGA